MIEIFSLACVVDIRTLCFVRLDKLTQEEMSVVVIFIDYGIVNFTSEIHRSSILGLDFITLTCIEAIHWCTS